LEVTISSEGSLPFIETLSYAERRLAGRLEGFGDIVFGFAVSQCALQLPVKAGHVDILHPLGFLLYLGTFALIASLWMIYHRMMSGAYKPGRLDLLLAFAYLALVSLMPFAMYAISHASNSLSGARAALAQYTALYAGMTAIAALVSIRNLRRGYRIVDASDNDRTWQAALRMSAVCSMMLLGLAIDLMRGPAESVPVYPCIAIAIAALRRLTPHAPSERILRLAPLEHRPA
jgi:uncharacterized membrane protein